MAVPESIVKLCEIFELHKEHYKSSGYNETELRREFLDPFFKALGWDVDNEQGYADAYKDVIHEDAIKVGGFTKAPDYCFRIGGTRTFFVEAKKPSVNIHGDIAPAFQLRRYGWSAKLPLSILSDFEELAVYDTRIKPVKSDKSAKARTMYFTYDQYAERWDEIASIFSREAVLKGSFDKYADTSKKKRGTGAVDDAFLEEIERWRDALARNLALRNPALTIRDLNYAVQKTIDRLIFLRICEDRGTEDYGRLQALQNGVRVYPRLVEFFKQADDRYNSGLFHFDNGEKGRSDAPDALTPDLNIDDKVLKDILKHLYYPDSPYEFSVLPADILGQVYEQFLGKTISLTPGHQAKIKEKPEVRKAGGVYYTPSYIVDYIVKNTLGRLLDGDDPEKPKPISVSKAAEIKVLDPACGSGSFLIVAYQYLLDWHLRQYTVDPDTTEPDEGKIKRHAGGKNPKIYQASGAVWRLTTPERKRILLNNIHGVDIDSQAVEVTKLSLLLKVLEGETQQKLQRDFIRERQRILPDLGNNIQCGNSLIGPDFYEDEQMLLLDEETQYRINVFDWNSAFADIMQRGGFDCVIGNPPYGFHQIHTPLVKEYFKSHLIASQGSFEHYFLFYEASLRLLRDRGLHGFIVPVTWLMIPSAKSLRRFVLDNYSLRFIAWLPALVFRNAQVNTLVSIIEKASHSDTRVLISTSNDPGRQEGRMLGFSQKDFISSGYEIHIFEDASETRLLDKLDEGSQVLSLIARPCSGYNPYEIGKGLDLEGNPHSKATVKEKPYHSKQKLGVEWKSEVAGRDLTRYHLKWPEDRFVKYGPWLSAPRDPSNFVGPRLLVQEITGGASKRIIATFTDEELYHSRDVIPIKFNADWPSPHFVLGIVNSTLITWRHHLRNPKAKKALFPKVLVGDLKNIPVPCIDRNNPNDVAMHDKMVSLVERMIDLNKKKADEKNPNILQQFETQIAATDRQIDQLVYKLYDLTEEEIKIVEGEK